jgi:hypothetical protein
MIPSIEPSFWYKLGLSFIVGSAWVTVSTIAAERFGSKVGGFLGGMPSTVVVALLFIGLTQTPQAASEATTIIPFAQGLNGLFVIVYILFIRRGLAWGLSSALLVWFFLASVIVTFGLELFWFSVAGWAAFVCICYLVVEKGIAIPSHKKVQVHYSLPQITSRALFGGAVIASAVFLGKLGGPIYGGIFATFPAMFLSTLVITYRTAGAPFSRAVGKTLMVTGMINVALYAIAVRYLYPRAGLVYGTMLALFCSLCAGCLTYLFVKSRLT